MILAREFIPARCFLHATPGVLLCHIHNPLLRSFDELRTSMAHGPSIGLFVFAQDRLSMVCRYSVDACAKSKRPT